MKTFTSESVCAGHPDKICDQISDAVLDVALEGDRYSRVAIETMVTKNFLAMAGEVTTKTKLDYKEIAQKVISNLGYNIPKLNFSSKSEIVIKIHTQSPEIAVGVDNLGAGDQGMMFGYASHETKELMPLPIFLAHGLTRKLAEVRKNKKLPYLRPDGKSQVSVEYVNGKPKKITTVVIAAHHSEDVSTEKLRADITQFVIKPVLGKWFNKNVRIFINSTGRFVLGGPPADAGLTGRKIIVDTYGGYAPHGGGAFSGKCVTKVDRSAAYAARYIAKNIVASGLAKKCLVQLAYAIGVAKPVSAMVDTYGTGKISDDRLEQIVEQIFPLKPADIIKQLNLERPIYEQTAAYGHFGRTDVKFPWEKTDKIREIKKLAKLRK